ncbi:BTAD domain-containing putative transcriptional regulator [Cellulomonas sp. ICMP 17802]|uniref:BTAD domain-containing putative transcriptional regulator n=1 Tax=Cellulomonas sp. ICMP 17802 TaxID=3239199 RepID=UPI00351BB5B2
MPADVGGARRRAVLAMLALQDGRLITVDTLIEGLWGEHLPASPKNAIHHHIARLRAALGDTTIVGTAEGYALRDARADALRFEDLLVRTRDALRDGDLRAADDAVTAALNLWRGQALQALPATEWFTAEARRLDGLHVDALEEQFDVALALGAHRDLAPALRSALAGNPFRERLWGQLMLALYRSGRQAEALETYQEVRRLLADELGVEPGPELRRLHDSILGHDPAIDVASLVRARSETLPASSTSFVGRADELAVVTARLCEHRLVTLVGPPGVGKSRLALETARSLQDDYPDGTWLVDFSRVDRPGDPVHVLADAVGVRGADPLERVVSRLRYLHALVVLDACERVVGDAARIVSEVLAGCAQVRVLAASREVLHLPGEVHVFVQPLGPAGVQLFVERARAARPGFEPDGVGLALAGRIVRRLDGLPLAIELAAARAGVLGLEEILAVLDRRTTLLRDLPVHDPARSSLQALVEWSYDLLVDDEKLLLHQLAVHRGGASLSSLCAMAAIRGLSEANVVSILGALVGKSVVSASFPAGAARYELLDAVREYVLDELAASGGLAVVREAHAEHFASLADSARTGLRNPDWLTWMDRLELELDNLRAALAHASEERLPMVAARLGAGLALYFSIAGRVSEGRAYVDSAYTAAQDASLPVRVELLAWACYLATEEDDLDAAVGAGQRGLALASGAGLPWETALVQLALAFAYDRAGRYKPAVALAEEARRVFDELGDRWGAASALTFGAIGALGSGNEPTAAALTADAVRLHGDYDVGTVPAALLTASLAERRGDADAACDAYRAALEGSERAGFADHASFALAGLGSVAAGQGRLDEAEAHLRRALAVAAAAPAPWHVAHARVRLAQLLETLGDVAGAASLYRDVIAWSEAPRRRQGREALFIALAGSPTSAALLGLAGLTELAGRAPATDDARGRAGSTPT